ncbi:hypothetical protein [Prauserella muralis]|uniref:Uncharacterized protein n=1 Tax=Prauserella muralis TaxID=588067 RepID=A0A2V4B0J8_9PSEU|nr:hypothetical protein [Prauserella muralis]PXY27537.1 hypothetical protein BAY60_14080 [Prauserella muralis]TWE22740.1 hypothetical protein FHX69_3991 [Prauserella muralis]
MGDGKGFESTPEDLATHAATVDRLGDRLTKVGETGAGVDLGIETYGIIGQMFSGGARDEITQTSDAIKEMGTGLSDFGEGVKAAGQQYAKVEQEIRELLEKFGGN